MDLIVEICIVDVCMYTNIWMTKNTYLYVYIYIYVDSCVYINTRNAHIYIHIDIYFSVSNDYIPYGCDLNDNCHFCVVSRNIIYIHTYIHIYWCVFIFIHTCAYICFILDLYIWMCIMIWHYVAVTSIYNIPTKYRACLHSMSIVKVHASNGM
jgi:hypothetical protein